MFRSALQKIGATAQSAVRSNLFNKPQIASTTVRQASTGVAQSDAEFDEECVRYLSRPNITGWQLRSFVNHQHGEDAIPEPKVMSAVLKACRQINDYALAIRYMEAVKWKCGRYTNIWAYLEQEIRPTLDELGILSLSEMGYDKPELWFPDVDDMHGEEK